MNGSCPQGASWVKTLLTDSVSVISRLELQAGRIAEAAEACVETLRSGGKILTAGNGGSAAEALHMAEEFVGRFRENRSSLPAICLAADPTALTCIANDFGYDEVFARQIEGLGRAGDLLVLFTTSGNARNLERALERAQQKGMRVLCLTGKTGGRLADRGDWEIRVMDDRTERIQEAHQVVVHILLEAAERAFRPSSP